MRSRLMAALAAGWLALGSPAAFAQDYPSRTVTLVLPFPAGSATDGIARHIAEQLQTNLKQPVIIENKPGADGIIAAQHAMRAEPNGYTVFVTTNTTHAINPALYEKLPYDPVKDFLPVGGLMQIPSMLCVKREFPAKDLAGFLELARARPQPLLYGSGNMSSRVSTELLKSMAKIDMTHVAYRGSPQAITDLLGGHIDVYFADPFSAMSLVNEGSLRALAVTDRQRSPLMPDVPTMIELGYRDFQVVSWVAAFLPARTDPAIAARLNREINAILARPETRAFIEKIGASVMPTSPEALGQFVQSEIAHWGRLMANAGIERKAP